MQHHWSENYLMIGHRTFVTLAQTSLLIMFYTTTFNYHGVFCQFFPRQQFGSLHLLDVNIHCVVLRIDLSIRLLLFFFVLKIIKLRINLKLVKKLSFWLVEKEEKRFLRNLWCMESSINQVDCFWSYCKKAYLFVIWPTVI